jgi:hypothetical protein
LITVHERTLTTTLRKVFDIPEAFNTTITLNSSFDDQKIGIDGGLKGINVGEPIDIDQEITFQLPASSVFVFEGVDNGDFNFDSTVTEIGKVNTPFVNTDATIYDMSGRRMAAPQKGLPNIIGGKKVLSK